MINPDECKGDNNNNSSSSQQQQQNSQIEYKFELIKGPLEKEISISNFDNRIKNYIHSADFQLIKNIELCERKCQKSIHHLEFTSKTGLDYQTGDTLFLYAENKEEIVKEIAEYISYLLLLFIFACLFT